MARRKRSKPPAERTTVTEAEAAEPARGARAPRSHADTSERDAEAVPDLDARDRSRSADRKAAGPPRRQDARRRETSRESVTDEVAIAGPSPAEIAEGDR